MIQCALSASVLFGDSALYEQVEGVEAKEVCARSPSVAAPQNRAEMPCSQKEPVPVLPEEPAEGVEHLKAACQSWLCM